jgi:lysozyme family protein
MKYSQEFLTAFCRTVDLEGRFVNHPLDRGGPTKFGLSKKANPELDIPNLTIDQAREVYFRKYWNPLQIEKINSEIVQCEIFDTGVNCGKSGTALISQRALHFLGEELAIDGWFGPETLGKINFWVTRDIQALFKAMNGFQFIWYVDLVKKDPFQRVFTRGWMKRIQEYREEVCRK